MLCLMHNLQACTPLPNFNYATLDEQVKYASAIMVGEVVEMLDGDGYNDAVVNFAVDKYLKGCGDSTITVGGFLGGSMCGSGIPRLRDKLVLFACEKDFKMYVDVETNQKWVINTFSMFTGLRFLEYDETVPEQVNALLKQKPTGPNDCSTLAVCGSRPEVIPPVVVEEENDDLIDLENISIDDLTPLEEHDHQEQNEEDEPISVITEDEITKFFLEYLLLDDSESH